MRTFTDTPVTKAQLIAALQAHRAADRIIQGSYWTRPFKGRGCAIGCSIHDFAPGSEDSHAMYGELFGIPEAVAQLEDRIFEGLPAGEEARDWPLRFAAAVPEGADLTRVGPAVLARILERRLAALPELRIDESLRERIATALRQTIRVIEIWRDAGTADLFAARAAENAASAVWRTAESASWNGAWEARTAHLAASRAARAAWSAVASATESAARRAWETAAWNAESAAWTAESAAWTVEIEAEIEAGNAGLLRGRCVGAMHAEYRWLADALCEEMQRCGERAA